MQFAEVQPTAAQEAAVFFRPDIVEMGAANSCASARTVDPHAHEAVPHLKGRIAPVNAAILPAGGGAIRPVSPTRSDTGGIF